MLRISKLADYATVIMVYLSRRAPKLSSAREVASFTHLALPTVSKILKKLNAAGLLHSVRGVAGGYSLQFPAAEISIAQIVYAVDDSRGLTECSWHNGACSLQSVCQIKGNWQAISQAVDAALDSVSLETLAKPVMPVANILQVEKLASGVRRG